MTASASVSGDFKEQIAILNRMLDRLEALEEAINSVDRSVARLTFFSVADVAAMTGWSYRATSAVFNKPDFPSCGYVKGRRVVELTALKNYFSVPHHNWFEYGDCDDEDEEFEAEEDNQREEERKSFSYSRTTNKPKKKLNIPPTTRPDLIIEMKSG